MLLLIWSVAVLAVLMLYFHNVYSSFKKRGVKTDKVVPLLGSMARTMLRREHLVESLNRSYRIFPKERFVGRYEFMTPMLLIRDLELIKKITVKDFDYFIDRRKLGPQNGDPLFFRNLLFLNGQEWKDMRSTLSPAFTSSKIRMMVPFMVDVGEQMIQNLQKTIRESSSEYQDIDVKDLTARYANDVIASCAFGLKVDSHSDRDNEFYSRGLQASTFSFRQIVLFFISAILPSWVGKMLNVNVFDEDSRLFLRNLVLRTIADREKNNIVRPDMIHLLMEAKKGKLSLEDKSPQDNTTGFAAVEESSTEKTTRNIVWTDDDLVAQGVIFFIAGFETVSTTMSFLLYELAVNPDVQDKLAAEIKETDARNGGKFVFNSIQQMTYMDMVVSEVLRLWCPVSALDRLCVKDYNLGKPNEDATEDYIIHKGEGLQIPVWSIHRDPEYFPDPEKFDPERFSEQNKHSIKSFSYSPFGLGPRNCIGSRFALCEVKIMTYQLLLHIEVSPGPRTTIPAQLDNSSFNIKLKGGHWLRFRIRS